MVFPQWFGEQRTALIMPLYFKIEVFCCGLSFQGVLGGTARFNDHDDDDDDDDEIKGDSATSPVADMYYRLNTTHPRIAAGDLAGRPHSATHDTTCRGN